MANRKRKHCEVFRLMFPRARPAFWFVEVWQPRNHTISHQTKLHSHPYRINSPDKSFNLLKVKCLYNRKGHVLPLLSSCLPFPFPSLPRYKSTHKPSIQLNTKSNWLSRMKNSLGASYLSHVKKAHQFDIRHYCFESNHRRKNTNNIPSRN